MIELKDILLEDIKSLELSKPYNLIYLDYNKEKGIKIFKENDIDKKDVHSLLDDDLKNMYRLYIFNDDSMITIYNFGNEYKYSKIDKEDINEVSLKYIYLKETDKEKYKDKTKALNERLKVRIGTLKENLGREVVQNIGYIGGENQNGKSNI